MTLVASSQTSALLNLCSIGTLADKDAPPRLGHLWQGSSAAGRGHSSSRLHLLLEPTDVTSHAFFTQKSRTARLVGFEPETSPSR